MRHQGRHPVRGSLTGADGSSTRRCLSSGVGYLTMFKEVVRRVRHGCDTRGNALASALTGRRREAVPVSHVFPAPEQESPAPRVLRARDDASNLFHNDGPRKRPPRSDGDQRPHHVVLLGIQSAGRTHLAIRVRLMPYQVAITSRVAATSPRHHQLRG